jgi:hypothetical protein
MSHALQLAIGRRSVSSSTASRPRTTAASRARLSPQQSALRNHNIVRMLKAERGRADSNDSCEKSASSQLGSTPLAVGHVNDPLEDEADRVADQVMRIPGPKLFVTGTRPQISRKCAACEEETTKKVQNKQVGVPDTSAQEGPGIVHDVLRSSGQALDASTRAYFEDRFQHDFTGVRMHTDTKAAASARALSALAYTVGQDVVFAEGLYTPHTRYGRWLMAHELAHTIQQGNATPHNLTTAASRPLTLQRFGSREHVEIGNLAMPGQMAQIKGYGTVLLGEMIAMAGDYFESLDELESVASQGSLGKQQIDLVRWKVNGSVGPKPAVDPSVETAVQARYDDLASRNQTHFSTGSSPGRSNQERYISLHAQAISAAYQAGAWVSGGAAFPLHVPDALEGFAEHFLTDAFSAGHVRTPRGELKSYWDAKYPDFKPNLLDFISCNMAAYIKDVDHVFWSTETIRDGVHFGPVNKDGVKDTVRALAGRRLDAYALGDLISKAMHDADNRGLDVTSPSDPTGSTKPFKWRAVGDEQLFPATSNPEADMTQKMVVTAVKWSQNEVQQATEAGMGPAKTTLTQLINPTNYRALSLIPTEDKTSAFNPTYAWKTSDVRSLPTAVKDIVRDQFKPSTEIRRGLDGVAAPVCKGEYHSGSAWDCFKQLLLADPIEALAKIAEGKTCPSGNPCPALQPTTTCP